MNLFSFSVEKELSLSFKSFIKEGTPVCIIEMEKQKIVCCGCSFSTTRKKKI